MTIAVVGWLGVAVTDCPMKTPLDAVDVMASAISLDTAWAAVRDVVVMVAVTSIEPAVMERTMAAASTPAVVAREEM